MTEGGRESIRRNVRWVYFSTFTFFLAGAIFYLVLARLLPQDKLGSVVVLLAIATLVSSIFSLGLGQSFQHFLSFYLGRKDSLTLRALTRNALVVTLGLSALASLVTYLLSPFLSTVFFHSPDYVPQVEFVALYAGLITAAILVQSILLGLQRFVAYAAITVVMYVTIYGAPLVLLFVLHVGLRDIVLGWSAGAGVGALLYLVAVAVYYPRVDPLVVAPPPRRTSALYRTIALYSLPLFIASVISTGATYVDRLVLAGLTDLSNVGVYNYAILVGSGSLIIVAPFQTILVPKISEAFGKDEPGAIRAMVRTASTLIILIYVPFALAVAAVGPVLLGVLVGSTYVPAAGPMAILLVLSAVAVPYSVLTSLATGVRRTSALVYASSAAIGLNASLSFLLVPRIGMAGAAVGNSAMSWGILLVLMVALRSNGLYSFDRSAIGRTWGSAAAMAALIGLPLLYFGETIWLAVPLLLLGAAVLVVLLRVSRAVPGEVREFVERLLPRRLGFLRPLIRWVAPREASASSPQIDRPNPESTGWAPSASAPRPESEPPTRTEAAPVPAGLLTEPGSDTPRASAAVPADDPLDA